MMTARQAYDAICAEYRDQIEQARKTYRPIDALCNEGGEGYSCTMTAESALYDHYRPLMDSAEHLAFAEEWTMDATTARRAAWNAAVVAAGKSANPLTISRMLGYRLDDIKRAMALHGMAAR